MEQFLALFFPAFIATKLFDHLSGGKMSLRNLVLYYGTFVTFIALIATVLVRLLANEHAKQLFEYGMSVWYLSLAVIAALVLPFVIALAQKAIAIQFEVVKSKPKKEQ